MADEVLKMEVRLENFISKELKKISTDLGILQTKAKESFNQSSVAADEYKQRVNEIVRAQYKAREAFVQSQTVSAQLRSGMASLSTTISSLQTGFLKLSGTVLV